MNRIRRPGLSALAGALVLVGGFGAGAPSASAAPGDASPGWVIQAVPVTGLTPNGHLSAVSCPRPASCVAVGYGHDGHGVDVPLAVHWDGATWTASVIPDLPAPGGASLNGH